MKRAVVVGHTGFIGRHLAAHLRLLGWEVQGISSESGDLGSPEGMQALEAFDFRDAVVFLTAAVTPDRGVNLSTFGTNLRIAASIASCLERRAPSGCVYFSSDAVYKMGEAPINEDSEANPADFYAAAKRAGELVLIQAARRRGVGVLLLRCTAIFGPGDTHAAYGPNRFCRLLAQDRTIELFGGGEERRDHLYIDDLVRLTVNLVDVGARGVVNAVSGVSRTFLGVARELESVTGRTVPIVSIPRRGAITHRDFDTSRLRQYLPGFVYTSFRDGLRATYAEACERGSGPSAGADG